MRQRARELERAYQELESELGRAASEEEVAERMGVTRKELDVLMQKIRGTSVLSLEEFLPNEKGYEIPLLGTLKDNDNDVTSAVEAREVKAALVKAVDELPPQERTVISLYYFEGLTLKEIKGVLNVSESRVRRFTPKPSFICAASCAVSPKTWAIVRAIPTSSRNICAKPPRPIASPDDSATRFADDAVGGA